MPGRCGRGAHRGFRDRRPRRARACGRRPDRVSARARRPSMRPSRRSAMSSRPMMRTSAITNRPTRPSADPAEPLRSGEQILDQVGDAETERERTSPPSEDQSSVPSRERFGAVAVATAELRDLAARRRRIDRRLGDLGFRLGEDEFGSSSRKVSGCGGVGASVSLFPDMRKRRRSGVQRVSGGSRRIIYARFAGLRASGLLAASPQVVALGSGSPSARKARCRRPEHGQPAYPPAKTPSRGPSGYAAGGVFPRCPSPWAGGSG